MRNYFTFAGRQSVDFGVYISGSGVFDAPERAYEPITIPGRNGAILGKERRLENIELTYPAFIYANFRKQAAALKSFLLSRDGYQRLEDTYYPEEFRLAYYTGGLEADMLENLRAGNFDVTFNCKPQRYLKTGTMTTQYTAAGTIFNPTEFAAAPLIRAYGSGTVTIGDTTITISTTDAYTDIDCELMEAYFGTESRNSAIQLSTNDFPLLESGMTSIGMSGVTRVGITPRWWRV